MNKNEMPFARPFAKIILAVGLAGCIAGRLAEEITTREMCKYFGILFVAAALLSIFSKKSEDSFMKLMGQLILVTGFIGGVGYAIYAHALKDVSARGVGNGIDHGVRFVARPTGSFVKRKFDGFMDGVEKTTVRDQPKK
ncbi:MAG: hypothetical protein AAB879_00710 [Patescibacteria group bacterium]